MLPRLYDVEKKSLKSGETKRTGNWKYLEKTGE